MPDLKNLHLDGKSLTVSNLAKASRQTIQINPSKQGIDRMQKSRLLVDKAVQQNTPVYGVTTGLGARATEVLSLKQLSEFSYQTIRGRAHAVGNNVNKNIIRAAMIIRANTFLHGAAAASPTVCQHYLNCLNADLTPVVGELGSVGAGDLVWNATLGLALIGEGNMSDKLGNIGPSDKLMREAGISIPDLGPRDGLAICNHASYSAAYSAMALDSALKSYNTVQQAACLSLEGFSANLTAFDSRILSLRPQPGQAHATADMIAFLKGSELLNPTTARRLQDPLSFRNIPQIHGTTRAALDFAQVAIEIEINGVSDNPVALVDAETIISAGAYHTPHLTNVVETVSRSFVHFSMAQLARMSKLLLSKFTELPTFLADESSVSNGFAPLMKTAESVIAELTHLASPVAIWPSINANGVEDSLTNTPTAAKALMQIAQHSIYLSAIELLIATRAVELRGNSKRLGPQMRDLYNSVREVSQLTHKDKPLTTDIEALVCWIKTRSTD